jgi:hypothetical protein
MHASVATKCHEGKAQLSTTAGTAVNKVHEPRKCHTLRITSSDSKARAEGRTPYSTTMTWRDDDNDYLPREFRVAVTRNATPCHLNDVPMASLELELPRSAVGDSSSGKTKVRAIVGVLSIAQHDMMKTERENAIRRGRPRSLDRTLLREAVCQWGMIEYRRSFRLPQYFTIRIC